MNAFIVYWSFGLISIAVAGAVGFALRSKASLLIIAAWMALTAALAGTGALAHFDRVPPPAGLLFGFGLLATLALGLSKAARPLTALPLRVLIGFQSFRILVEILIHLSNGIGLAPTQMTWSGMNFDVLTGMSALVIAPFADRLPRAALLLWNTAGLLLLLWVVSVAFASFPTPFQLLKPDNTWVAHFPYVWLPTVLVTAALLGHIVLFRKLLGRTKR